MAICVPNNMEIKNSAEDRFYKFIKENLDDNFILYHNHEVNGKEFDFLLLDKNSYLYLIEVKGWNAVDVISIDNNKLITYKDNNNDIKTTISNPLQQVRGYKFNLIKRIKNEFNFEPKIVHLVCYPRISKKDFYNRQLDIISEEHCTILKDDFNNEKDFLNKIYEASNKYQVNYLKLTNNQIYHIRSMFESLDSIDYVVKEVIKENNLLYCDFFDEIKKIKSAYSILIYIAKINENEIDDVFLKLIDLWRAGTKIHIISNNKSLLKTILKILKCNLNYLESYEDFKMNDEQSSIFNFWTYNYFGDDLEENFLVIDGEYLELEKELKLIDERSNFNFYQYKLEHFKINNNIIVKAGAGTGKTYSMISRITYLIYKHRYSPEEMIKNIYLITFTNEAADNMKNRLRSYFMSYYILTKNLENFRRIEYISKMNISTIHSLCKKIVDKFSTELGLGTKSKIIQGSKEKNNLVDNLISKFLKENYLGKDSLEVFGFRSYELRDRIISLVEKIEQKNILLNEDYNFGNDTRPIDNLIKSIVPEIQKQLLLCANNDNNVRLSQLIILIKQLLKNPEVIKHEEINLDYLFVDEFQDTDDIQIELMKEFQKIINFNFFVVGDIKQCIYRFRGAQDDAFDKLLDSKEKFYDCKLVKNYRTDKDLLEKFHPIFNYWGNRDELTYRDEDKLIGVKNINNNILKNIDSIEYDDKNFEEVFIEKLQQEKSKLEYIYQNSISNNKRNLTIAILVRTNYEIENIKNICDKNEILIDADISGSLYDLECSRDLYTLVLALKNNKDPKCLFNIFSTNYTLDKEDRSIMFNCNGDRSKLLDYFEKINPIDEWNNYILRLKFEPVMKILREIIFKIQPWNIYAVKFHESERERRALFYKRNLEQVLENIIRNYNNEYLTLNKLIESLNISIFTNTKADLRENIIDIERNGVNIVCKTIHKSKGLEYDVVLLPYANKNINDKKIKGNVDVIITGNDIGYSILEDSIFEKSYRRIENSNYKEESEVEYKYKFNEEVRIIYVALTRAISKVVYFKSNKMKKQQEKRVQDLIEIKY